METKDIADLFIVATGKIEFYWNFYTVTLLALIGWFVSSKKVFGSRLQLLITIGYLAFVSMNIIGLLGSYTFAEALRLDLLKATEMDNVNIENIRAVISERSFEPHKKAVFVVHGALGIFVLSFLWFGKKEG